jgi:hypothetical protein
VTGTVDGVFWCVVLRVAASDRGCGWCVLVCWAETGGQGQGLWMVCSGLLG